MVREIRDRMLTAVAVLLLAAALIVAPNHAKAQTVTPLPVYTDNQVGNVKDLGNGPLEIRVLNGNAQLFVMSSSGSGGSSPFVFYGTGPATTLVLAATPTVAPCVGCIINGTGIVSGVTILAYDGGTKITLASSVLAASPQTLSWGAACPSTLGSQPVMLVQAGVGADLPLYTQARICASGQNAAGAQLLPFAIGAH